MTGLPGTSSGFDLLGLIGLIVASMTAIWQVASYLLGRARVRVRLFHWAHLPNGHDVMEPVKAGTACSFTTLPPKALPGFAVVVVNKGGLPTTVQRVGILYNDSSRHRAVPVPLLHPPAGPIYPKLLDIGTQEQWTIAQQTIDQIRQGATWIRARKAGEVRFRMFIELPGPRIKRTRLWVSLP